MEDKGKLSVIKGSFLLMNTMFGAGVVCVPNGFMAMGYLGGSALLALAVMVTILTLIFLCLAVEKTKIKNFAELSGKMGRFFGIFLDCLVALLCYGSTLCYFLMLVKNITNALFDAPGKKEKAITGIILSIPLFFLSIMKSLDKLSFTSMLTVFSTFFVGLSLLIWNFTNRTDLGKSAVAFSSDIMRGYPSLLFALGCQQNAVAIYSSLKNRSTRNGIITMSLGAGLAFGLYLFIGIFGYLTFGDIKKITPDAPTSFFDIITKRGSDFIKNMSNTFDKKAIMAYLLNVAFSCVLFSAFPLQTLAARSAISNLFFKEGMSDGIIKIATLIQLSTVYLLSVFDTDVGVVVDFIGTTACPLISFFFPSAIYLYFFRKKSFMFFAACGIGLMSLVIVISGVFTQIKGIMSQ